MSVQTNSAHPDNVPASSCLLQVPSGMKSESTQIRVTGGTSGMVRSTPLLFAPHCENFQVAEECLSIAKCWRMLQDSEFARASVCSQANQVLMGLAQEQCNAPTIGTSPLVKLATIVMKVIHYAAISTVVDSSHQMLRPRRCTVPDRAIPSPLFLSPSRCPSN